jgi:REP element-mobilizing transposase RayT
MPQSLAKVYIHAIFSTKHREPLLTEGWRDELFSVVGGAANNLDRQSLIVGGVADHVHILFQLGRKIAVSDAISKIKSTSSLWVRQAPAGREEFHWQAGYAAFSVSQSSIEAVREYIRNQAEHHRNQSFQDELRERLRRYEVEWTSVIFGIDPSEWPFQGHNLGRTTGTRALGPG